jgi:hypothetical protein
LWTVERPSEPDTLGPVLEALQIDAGPAAGVVPAALIARVKSRSGNVKLVLKLQRGGSAEQTVSLVKLQPPPGSLSGRPTRSSR